VGAGKLLGQAVDVVEVAVRLVLVLLLELAVVKAFIVELGPVSARGGGAGGSSGAGADGRLGRKAGR